MSHYCWPRLSACEENRDLIHRERFGKAGPCVTQRTAHCFIIADTRHASRRFVCARTAQICQARQKWLKDHRTDKFDRLSACDEVFNTEYYPGDDEPLQRPRTGPTQPVAP